jgi:hypothetical protein
MTTFEQKIADLEVRIERYEVDRHNATTPEEKEQYSQLILSTERTIQKLFYSEYGANLKDGIPKLRHIRDSPKSYIPYETEHASCSRVIMDLPFVPTVTGDVLNASNSVWREIRTWGPDDGIYRYYSSEVDIMYFLRSYLLDILLALKIRLDFNTDVAIRQIQPDLCVLSIGMYLVGVVLVKSPRRNVLLEPTVLGELLDQMLLVEGFYGMGPIIGILTTGEEWIVSWFPVDTDILAHSLDEPPAASFSTAVGSTGFRSEPFGHRPPGGTPSQKSGFLHRIEADVDVFLDHDDDNAAIVEEMERLLCCTEVLNIHSNPVRVLEVLSGAFQLMATSHLHHHSNLPRCLLKFHKKNIGTVTFHPASYKSVHSMIDFDKFPNTNVKTLVALEDLGRGSTGKAWLCAAATKPRSTACVLKFDNTDYYSLNLRIERDMWHLLYPEFSHMVKLERWSGADALVMPHFSTVFECEREQYKDELITVLNSKFMNNGKVHNDVHWRNIGKYRNKDGNVSLVLFDLRDVVDYNVDLHNNWIGDAVNTLFVDV